MSNKHSVSSKSQPETDDSLDAIGRANQARAMFGQINQTAKAFIVDQTKQKYEFLALVYTSCCDFTRRNSDWAVFIADAFFDTNQQKPKAYDDETYIAKWVLYYATDARTSKARKVVGKAARVLQHFFDEACNVDEMMALIKDRGGITAVYEEIVREDADVFDRTEDEAGDWELFPIFPRTADDEDVDRGLESQLPEQEGGEEAGNAWGEPGDETNTEEDDNAPAMHGGSTNPTNTRDGGIAERGKPISKRIDLTTTLAVEMAESDIAKILGAKRATVSIEITSPTKESAFTRVVSKRVQVGDDNQ